MPSRGNEANLLMQYLDKRLFVQLNGSRKVLGVLRGYDVGRQPPRGEDNADCGYRSS